MSHLVLAESVTNLDKEIVYIECADKNGKQVSQGSGVIVHRIHKDAANNEKVPTSEFIVLTARHVVRPIDPYSNFEIAGKISCKGKVGKTDVTERNLTMIIHTPKKLDMALMRIDLEARADETKPLGYCNVSNIDSMRGRSIRVSGFPSDSKSRWRSIREGVISSTAPAGNGIDGQEGNFIEIDTQATTGMSGGMVTLGKSRKLLGIISNISFNSLGLPAYYSMIPIDAIKRIVENPHGEYFLPESNCQNVGTDQLEEYGWKLGDGDSSLRKNTGIKVDEGFCYITHVGGSLSSSTDRMLIGTVKDNYYVSRSNSGIYGTVNCKYY